MLGFRIPKEMVDVTKRCPAAVVDEQHTNGVSADRRSSRTCSQSQTDCSKLRTLPLPIVWPDLNGQALPSAQSHIAHAMGGAARILEAGGFFWSARSDAFDSNSNARSFMQDTTVSMGQPWRPPFHQELSAPQSFNIRFQLCSVSRVAVLQSLPYW